MPPLYSPQLLTSIKRTVTEERLRRYLRATGRDMAKALQLYEYNVQLSEVLYGLLHGLEVAVRNAEHFALTASYGTPAWYDAAPLPITGESSSPRQKPRRAQRVIPAKSLLNLPSVSG